MRAGFPLMTTRLRLFLSLAAMCMSVSTAHSIVHVPEKKPDAADDVALLRKHYPVVIYQGPKQPTSIRFEKNRPAHWVSYSEISKAAVGAVVVSEDWAFFQHKGFDMNQIKEAIKTDIERGKFARGASTITQQVAKNVFLSNEKTLLRKARELYLSVQLEKQLSKTKILEVYFNVVEWGEGIYGLRAAARAYFGKSPQDLLPKEGAFLAMLLPNPKKYSQSFRDRALTPYASKTIKSILQKMHRAGYVSMEEYLTALETPLSFANGSD